MKFVFYDESNMVLFLNNTFFPEINFKDNEELETYFKSLFLKIKERYEIDMNGYYQIDIYVDPFYGTIIEIEKEELDYFEYDNCQIDMRICIHQISILYELEEYIPLDKKIYDIIWYHNKWYVKLKEKINSISLGRLLEYAKIYYHGEIDKIIEYGLYI